MFQLQPGKQIRKFIALFLLLVFAMGTAPKAYFHDLVAKHKDFSTCHQLHHTTVLHQQGINCHCDDLVVSASFLVQADQYSVACPSLPCRFVLQDYTSFHTEAVLATDGRGPPRA